MNDHGGLEEAVAQPRRLRSSIDSALAETRGLTSVFILRSVVE